MWMGQECWLNKRKYSYDWPNAEVLKMRFVNINPKWPDGR